MQTDRVLRGDVRPHRAAQRLKAGSQAVLPCARLGTQSFSSCTEGLVQAASADPTPWCPTSRATRFAQLFFVPNPNAPVLRPLFCFLITQDPNQDLKEIFDTLESLPTAPLRLLQGLASWARGDDDPDWGAKGRKKQQGGGRK